MAALAGVHSEADHVMSFMQRAVTALGVNQHQLADVRNLISEVQQQGSACALQVAHSLPSLAAMLAVLNKTALCPFPRSVLMYTWNYKLTAI